MVVLTMVQEPMVIQASEILMDIQNAQEHPRTKASSLPEIPEMAGWIALSGNVRDSSW